jgi:hypothetical protein
LNIRIAKSTLYNETGLTVSVHYHHVVSFHDSLSCEITNSIAYVYRDLPHMGRLYRRLDMLVWNAQNLYARCSRKGWEANLVNGDFGYRTSVWKKLKRRLKYELIQCLSGPLLNPFKLSGKFIYHVP